MVISEVVHRCQCCTTEMVWYAGISYSAHVYSSLDVYIYLSASLAFSVYIYYVMATVSCTAVHLYETRLQYQK